MKTDQAEEKKYAGGTSDPVHTKAHETYLEDQAEQKQPTPPPPSRTITITKPNPTVAGGSRDPAPINMPTLVLKRSNAEDQPEQKKN